MHPNVRHNMKKVALLLLALQSAAIGEGPANNKKVEEVFPQSILIEQKEKSPFLKYSLPSALTPRDILKRFRKSFGKNVRFVNPRESPDSPLTKSLKNFEYAKIIMEEEGIIGVLTKESGDDAVYVFTVLGVIPEIDTDMELPRAGNSRPNDSDEG